MICDKPFFFRISIISLGVAMHCFYGKCFVFPVARNASLNSEIAVSVIS